jgi:hypothetical protein
MCSFFAGQYFEKSIFTVLSISHFLFDKPMPITYSERIKRPCNFTGTRSLVLQGKGEMDDD